IDRLAQVGLHRIEDFKRERDEPETWRKHHAEILGALLDLAVQVLAELPNTEPVPGVRMADFVDTLATVDRILGTDGVTEYRGQAETSAAESVESNPTLAAIAQLVKDDFRGTSKELLEQLEQLSTEVKLPEDARALT